jgi:hypothetical protein
LLHKDAYEQEQRNIQARKRGIQDTIQNLYKAADESNMQLIAAEGQILAQKLPILRDPNKGEKFRQEFYTMLTQDYGFTDKDINEAADHRLFLVAADALRYKMLRAKRGSNIEVKTTKARVAPKTTAKTVKRASMRQQERALAKARQTGSVDDVAATLLVPQRKR